MQYNEIKTEMQSILEIVNMCPAALQEKCFEMLLSSLLSTPNQSAITANTSISKSELIVPSQALSSSPGSSDEEITEKDLHTKTRRFLEQYNISVESINKLYYKEDAEILPLYDTLGCTQMSESQIRIMLLSAFETSFSSGDMTFKGEDIRKRCQEMKCYDMANFAKVLKTYSSYIDNWVEKYDKGATYQLSSEGKRRLANVLKEMIQGGYNA